MIRFAVLFVATFGLLLPSVARGETVTQRYNLPTSAIEGKAVCAMRVIVHGVAGQNLQFKVVPAPTNATGDNGGEIKLRKPSGQTPGPASAGVEDACDIYLNAPDASSIPITGANQTVDIVALLHSHPGLDCAAAFVAKGLVRMTVAGAPTGTIEPSAMLCTNDETRANVGRTFTRRPRRLKRAERMLFKLLAENHGPADAVNGRFVMTMPRADAFVESATVDGQPCTISQTTTAPIRERVVCPLGDMPTETSSLIDLNVFPRTTNPLDMTMTIAADNIGDDVFANTQRVSTPVAQTTSAMLALTVNAKNNKSGSVNVSPPAANTPGSCSVAHPATPETVCIHTYGANTKVNLTAKPGTGATVRWEGACAGTTGNGPCSVTINPNAANPDKSVTVKFR